MRLKELRREKGIKQKELAELLDVSVATICRYERGEREPDNKTLVKLANYFHVPIDYLLERPSESVVALSTPKGYEQLNDSERKEVEQFIGYIRAKKSQK
ncbi:MAG: helix-turn-helix transcriptional regulator [Christensenellaceae bacterium]